MKVRPSCARLPAGLIFAVAISSVAANAAEKDARVTQIIREVKLMPSEEKPRLAELNDKVRENTAVRTGADARSELTFVDLTITRLGANTIFTFSDGGRSVRLNGGAMLLRVPKDSGGAQMKTSACSVAITGTTVILEAMRSGRNKLTALEGGALMSLNKNPKESAYVRAGQMVDVPAGATKMPAPVDIDVDQVMKKNPLITDFPPLPSRDLIYASKGNQSEHIYQGHAAGNQTSPSGPVSVHVIPNILGGGTLVPNTPGRPSGRPGKGKNKPTFPGGTNVQGANVTPKGAPTPSPTPSPTPRKKKS